MDLRNNKITIGELYQNPKVRAILEKEYPKVVGHPMLRIAWDLPLYKAIAVARDYVPQAQIDAVLSRLQAL